MKEYHWIIETSGSIEAKNQKEAEHAVNELKKELINDDPFPTIIEVEEI